MTRAIDPATEAALTGEVITGVNLAAFDFPVTPVHVTNVPFDVQFNGETYKGVGSLGQISPVEESAELKAQVFAFQLSGIDNALVAVAKQQHYQGRKVRVWEAALDPDTHAIVGQPLLWFAGRMDAPKIEYGPRTSKLTLTATNRLASWEQPRVRRRTDADQQARYPGDKMFEFQNDLKEKEIKWG